MYSTIIIRIYAEKTNKQTFDWDLKNEIKTQTFTAKQLIIYVEINKDSIVENKEFIFIIIMFMV